jgi:hypothetical protein
MARRKGTVFAAPAKHYARVASVLNMSRTNQQEKSHIAMSATTRETVERRRVLFGVLLNRLPY